MYFVVYKSLIIIIHSFSDLTQACYMYVTYEVIYIKIQSISGVLLDKLIHTRQCR